MKALTIFLMTVVILSGLTILLIAIYSGKPIKRLIINALSGLSVLAVLYFTAKYTGINIHINPITVVGASVFSIPAVIGFLLMNVILL